MAEAKGGKPSQLTLEVGGVVEDTWPHVDSQPGGPLHERNLRKAREAAAIRSQQTGVDEEGEVAAPNVAVTETSSKIPEKFIPGSHLFHIFGEPLVGTVRDGVLVGVEVLLADLNGETYKVRGGFKPIYVSRTGFTIESIKDERVSDCAPGTKFYRRPYRASKPSK